MSDTEASSGKRLPAWAVWLIRAALLGIMVTALVLSPTGVAAVVAGILIAAALIYWWLRSKFKKFLQPFADIELFPEQIQLLPQKRAAWHHPEEASGLENAVLGLGYEGIGRFTIDKTPGVLLGAFHHSSPPSYAVVYDYDHLGVNIDFFCQFEDDSYLTCTSDSVTEMLEKPPNMPVVHLPEGDPPTVFDRFLAEVGDRPVKPLSRDDFATVFETYHAEEHAWQAENAKARERLDRAIRESFLSQSGWSAIEWDRKQERVLFIHDEIQNWMAVREYMDAIDPEDEDLHESEEQRAKDLCAELPVRRAFSAMVQKAPAGREFSKLLELSEPVPVDVYLAPEDQEEAE